MSSLQQTPKKGQAAPPAALIDGVSEQQIDAAVKAHVRREEPKTGPLPSIFVSGRRGHLAMHSGELADWMGVDNERAHAVLLWQNGNRPESWWIGNCWNKSEVFSHNRANMTFKIRRSYWISESVAMGLCRKFRKDLLPSLRSLFAQERERDIKRQVFLTGGSRASRRQEVRA
ncbi:hypothetical protein [Paracandidimonas soli]|uniref:Uncharacterized protein n=1 Tax=Paracandidimonas soli TaxID=1917182 RepID=A0A4R3UJ60_9BURK|nr:hypothetical protein [Paracandidimonas soli]TCU91635.1 hypothetical protein EV686_11731 [Paracandidimonas soli]